MRFPRAATPILVTNGVGLNQVASARQGLVVSVRLEGTGWWSEDRRGRLIFKDDSGAEQLELDVPGELPIAGERLRLEGDCAVSKPRDTFKLASVLVVDNAGLHAAEERLGSIELKAGRHPIQVAWLNRTDRFELEVGYEGPDLPRQKIPTPHYFAPRWRK